MTIAITGVTGQLGRLVVPRLLSKTDAANIIGLARTPAKGANLGVTMREADYEKTGTLESALQGVGTLLLISSSEFGKRELHHKNTIDAPNATGFSGLFTRAFFAPTLRLLDWQPNTW